MRLGKERQAWLLAECWGREKSATHLPTPPNPPQPCSEQPSLELAPLPPPKHFLLLNDQLVYSLLMGVL